MDRTTEYAKLVLSRKRIAGRSERLACKRHLDDMAAKDSEWIFDVEEAERHIDIANTLTIGEGAELKKLKTRGFQNFIIGNLFGWRKKRSKIRKYREAYVQMGRQNGKSFISGILANDFATFGGYKYGRIFCTATKQEQANIVWDEIAKFIESDKDLSELYSIKKYERTITSKVTGSVIKAIGRDTKSADGFRTILAIVDEYHAHKTDQMYKLMLDGQDNVNNALTIAITTAGFNLSAPCKKQYDFCKRVLEGVVQKDSLFIYIAEPDKDDDIWDPETWMKANPLKLWKNDTERDEQKIAIVAAKAIDAREKGGEDLVNFQTKTLNTWVEYTGGSLLDLAAWKNCGGSETIEDMAGKDAYLGIDLSSGGDLTSIALLFPLSNGLVYIWSHSYMPERRLQEHIKTDSQPYGIWKNQGLITLTSGMYGIKTDYKYIIADLKKIITDYKINIVACGYDSHNAAAFLADLDEILDCDLTEIRQSARSLNDPTADFALTVKAQQVEYDKNNALLSWSASNAILSEPNSFGETKIDKMTQTDRIDPIDAIIDAWALYFNNKDKANEIKAEGQEALDIWLSSFNDDDE